MNLQQISEDAWAQRARDWWPIAALSAFAVALGAAFLFESRKEAKAFVRSLSGGPEGLALSPGQASFERVIMKGVVDGELQFKRQGMKPLLPVHRTFTNAKLLGISPTELAVTGRYFGEDELAVRIEISADGRLWLSDGRRLYLAAKDKGANAILADVILRDRDGDVAMERRAVVNLI